jgi:nitrite reductase/ring-hydroxylating ferredoxin subunit
MAGTPADAVRQHSGWTRPQMSVRPAAGQAGRHIVRDLAGADARRVRQASVVILFFIAVASINEDGRLSRAAMGAPGREPWHARHIPLLPALAGLGRLPGRACLPVSTPAPGGWVRACGLARIEEGRPARAGIGGYPVCLVRTAAGVYALRDECAHQSVPLSEGEVADGAIEYRLHGSRSGLVTGRVAASCHPPGCRAGRRRRHLCSPDAGPGSLRWRRQPWKTVVAADTAGGTGAQAAGRAATRSGAPPQGPKPQWASQR